MKFLNAMTFQVLHDPYEPWIYKNFTYLLSCNNLACAYALHLFIYVLLVPFSLPSQKVKDMSDRRLGINI